MEGNTHIVFDGKKILISENLAPIFNFLVHIENEIRGLLGVRHQLESARKGLSGTLKMIKYLMEKYPEEQDGLKIDVFFEENPIGIADKLNFVQITRSEMIVLFANLETIMALNAIYELNTIDETSIIRKLMDKKYTKKFIRDYLLNIKNPFYRDNQDYLKFIQNSDIRDLRNSLAHFFSVKGITLTDEVNEDLGRKMEHKLNNKIKCLSPREMYELMQGAYTLMIIKWDKDFKENPKDFAERIDKVKQVVERDGAILVYTKDLTGFE
jgi:hypothetical protein